MTELKKRLIDFGFLILVGALFLGGFYVYAMIQGHRALDAKIIEILNANAPKPAVPVESK